MTMCVSLVVLQVVQQKQKGHKLPVRTQPTHALLPCLSDFLSAGTNWIKQ